MVEPKILDWHALLNARYWHPTLKTWCGYHTYDLECPKCDDGMLAFQAESDCVFGLVQQTCACRFTDDERLALEEDVDHRFEEKCRSYEP